MTTALSLRALRKRFRAGFRGCTASVDALRGVDLDVHLGEIVGLVGASGAGKSTLLLCAAGIVPPDDGQVTWFGVDHAFGIPPAGIAYVPDRATYYPFLTAREALEYYSTVRELGAHARGERVAWALNRVGLETLASRRIAQLSPGACRRIAVARVLLGAARLVLIDEPAEEIDARSRDYVRAVLAGMAEDGAGILVAARSAAALAGLATRCAELDAGRLRDVSGPRLQSASGAPATVVGRVAEPATH